MSDVVIFDRWRVRRGTAANLATVNEVPLEGELVLELDTGRFKFGDGSTNYNSLLYSGSGLIDLTGLSDGDVLAWDASNAKFVRYTPSSGGSTFNPRDTSTFFDDFRGKPPASVSPAAASSQDWVAASIGTGGSITSIDGGNTSPGVWRLACGTTTGAVTAITLGEVNNISVGGGELERHFRVRLPVLSDATNRYAFSIGLRDVWGGAANARLEVLYADNINGGAALIRAFNGTTTTDANGSSALVANTWYRFRLAINAAGTQAQLYVNDVLEATLSSGLPTAAMRDGIMIAKSAGTTSRNLDADFYKIDTTFTTAR